MARRKIDNSLLYAATSPTAGNVLPLNANGQLPLADERFSSLDSLLLLT